METVIAITGLILFTLVLGVVPLLPSLIELRRKSDTTPLSVAHEYNVDVHSFANSFRDYLDDHYHGAFEHCDERTKPFYGTDKEGKNYLVVTEENISLHDDEIKNQQTSRIFLACHCLRLPGLMSYLAEIYARQSVFGGEEDIFRAILAEQDIRLNPQSMSLRWMHAGRDLIVGRDCILHGRSSADHKISLDIGCQFERLYAPCIEFGPQTTSSTDQPQTMMGIDPLPLDTLGKTRRWLYRHDVVIPQGASIDADLVVYGDLTLASGSRINGSVKCHKRLSIDENVTINGSLVSNTEIRISNDCQIRGPVISEDQVLIGHRCQIGLMDQPTTVTAQHIVIGIGSIAYGTVWAHELGEVSESVVSSNVKKEVLTNDE